MKWKLGPTEKLENGDQNWQVDQNPKNTGTIRNSGSLEWTKRNIIINRFKDIGQGEIKTSIYTGLYNTAYTMRPRAEWGKMGHQG